MEIVSYLSSINGGGTDLGVPIKEAYKNQYNADVFIGITDNEDWYNHGVMNDLALYRNKINKNLHAYLVRIDPYVHDSAINIKDPRNHTISGWSNNVLDFITIMESSNAMLDYIKSTPMEKLL